MAKCKYCKFEPDELETENGNFYYFGVQRGLDMAAKRVEEIGPHQQYIWAALEIRKLKKCQKEK